MVIRKRHGALGVVDESRTAVRQGLCDWVNRIRRTFLNADVAGLAIISQPAMQIFLRERQVFDVGINCYQAHTRPAVTGDEQPIFTGNAQPSIHGNRDVIHMPAHGWTGVSVEPALAQEIGHFIHDHANFIVDPPQFKTKAEAKTTIFDFEIIEVWYNLQKLHPTLCYQCPAKFEQSFRH
jgi:hypothetical protein